MFYTELPHHFCLFCLAFGSSSKHQDCCNIHVEYELITSHLALESVFMTKLPGSFWKVVFVLGTKVSANTILEHYSQTMFMKIVHISRTGFTVRAVKVLGADGYVAQAALLGLTHYVIIGFTLRKGASINPHSNG